MEKKQLKRIADQTIRELIDYIEKRNSDIDIEELDDSVEINTKRANCVLNYHNFADQIWFASSEKGAYHFNYDQKNASWVSTKGEDLYDVINSAVLD